MEPYKQGIIQEQIDLQLKCNKLATFMMSEKFLSLPDRERGLLATQLVLMRQYSDVLIERMKAIG